MKKLILSTVCVLLVSFANAQLVMNNTGVTTNVCGGTFLDPGGAANYGNNLDYTMTICPGVAGQCMYLQFITFNLENGFDFLYVYDGTTTASPQVAGSPFTGTTVPGSLASTTGCLTLRFTSDAINTAPGWSANIICQPCGAPPPPPPGPITAGDCNQAVNICTNLGFSIDPNGFGAVDEIPPAGTLPSNPNVNPASANMGCLLAGETNSTWMIVNIGNSGTLEFTFGGGGAQAGYYDWAMWPYFAGACASIPTGGIAPVRCNWNGVNFGGTGLAVTVPPGGDPSNYEPALNVTCGQQFLICFSNYSSVSTTVPVQFGGTATVSCSTVLPVSVNNAFICPGGTATLTAGGATTYNWSTGASGTSINVSPATTTTYTVTGTGACGSGTATATVTVLSAADPACACSVTANNTGPYCVGGTLGLSATAVAGATGYSWAGPNGFTSLLQNPTMGGISVAGSGVYTVTVTTPTQTCTATTTVVVNSPPSPTSSNTGPYCAGATIQLNSTGGGTYAWSGPSAYSNATQNPTIGSSTTAMSGVYTVTVTNAAGCTSTSTTTVTVNPLPTPTSSNTGPYCAGATIQLNSTGGGTYAWSGPSAFSNATQNPTIGSSTTANGGVYTVTVTTAAGCTSSSTTTVTVNPLPAPTATNTGPYCAGATIQLNSTGGGTYSWSGPGAYSNATQNPTIAAATPAMSGVYTVTVTGAGGCTSTSTTTVTVNASANPTASNTGPYCAGATIQLNSGAGGIDYDWTGPAAYVANNTQNPTIASSTTAMSGVYTVTMTLAGGCTGTATTTVTVNPIPAPTSSNTGPYCAGATIQLNSTGGGTYAWAGPGAYSNATQNPTIGSSTTAMSGVYTVTVTSAAGCTSSSTTTVTVNPIPAPTSSNTGPYCEGATIQLNSTGGGTYAWAGPSAYANGTQNPTIGAATPANSGVYTVTVTSAAGCTSTSTTTVTVNPLPTPTSSNTGPYCEGATIQLNSTGGGTYSWSGPSAYSNATQNPSIASSTAAMTGVYTVTVTSAAGCTSSSTTAVTVNPLPAPTSSNTGPYCEGATIQLNSTGGGTYSWAGPLAYSNATQNPTIPASLTTMSGVYTVTVTSAAGCTSSSTTTVTVNTMPVPTASNTGPYCAGSTIQLNSTGGGTYAWVGPAAYANGTQNPTIGLAVTGMSGVYTVTVTLGGGCTASATTTVVVNALPIPNASNTGPYCEGANIQLNSGGGNTYSWSGPLAYANGTQNPTIAGSTPAMSGTYTVIVTDINNCTASATTAVTVNALPIPNASNTGPYCEGATIQLNSGGGNTYAWAGPGAYANATQNPTIGASLPAMTGTYTVTVTSVAGCTATATTNVVVNALPVPTANNTGPYCDGATMDLSSTGGVDFDWTGPGGFTLNNTQNGSIPGATPAMSGGYTVTVTDANGCSATATTLATINALPNAVANNNSPICELQQLDLTSGGGTNYDWVGPNGFTAFGTQNPSIAGATIAASGIYTVTVTDANGCISTATTTAVVNSNLVFTAASNSPLCEGSQLDLTADNIVGATYDWMGPNGYSVANQQNPSLAGATTAATGTYTVTATNANGCTGTATVAVTIHPLPTALFAGDNLSGCVPLCVNMSDLSNGNGATIVSWNWVVEGQTPSVNQNETFCFNNPGAFDAQLTVTTADGCTSTLLMANYINVYPNPVAEFMFTPQFIELTDPEVTFASTSTGATSWLWNFGDGSNSTIENPMHTYADTGTFCIDLLVSNNYGCTDTTTGCLYVAPVFTIYIPNAFTVNDDNLNETWNIYGMGIKTITVRIFDRWGEEIYFFDDINKGWPGTMQNGNPCKQDVYVYRIEVVDGHNDFHEFMGRVTLIR